MRLPVNAGRPLGLGRLMPGGRTIPVSYVRGDVAEPLVGVYDPPLVGIEDRDDVPAMYSVDLPYDVPPGDWLIIVSLDDLTAHAASDRTTAAYLGQFSGGERTLHAVFDTERYVPALPVTPIRVDGAEALRVDLLPDLLGGGHVVFPGVPR